MFPELSKIFGRDFVIAFFLPALVFWIIQGATLLVLSTDISRLASDSDMPAFVRQPAPGSGIRPIEGRILVQSSPAVSSTPSASPGRLLSGVVIAVDDAHVLSTGERAVKKVSVGDTVLFPETAGGFMMHGNQQLRVLSESELVARTPGQWTIPASPPTLTQLVSAQSAIILALAAWIVGILLMAINRELYRFFEGYGWLNPFRLFGGIERCRFKLTKQAFDALDSRYDNLPPDELRERDRLWLDLTKYFPEEEWLLPTRFGNIIRAFESYSLRMYGLDAIPGWERLELVIATETKDAIYAKKTEVDFWLNMWLFGLLLLVEFCWLAYTQTAALWAPLVVLLVTLLVVRRAKSKAILWGESVKAAVDISLPKLAKEMGLALPEDRQQEREFWKEFSQAILYRREDLLPRRAAPPKADDADPPQSSAASASAFFTTVLFTATTSPLPPDPAPAPDDPAPTGPASAKPAGGAGPTPEQES